MGNEGETKTKKKNNNNDTRDRKRKNKAKNAATNFQFPIICRHIFEYLDDLKRRSFCSFRWGLNQWPPTCEAVNYTKHPPRCAKILTAFWVILGTRNFGSYYHLFIFEWRRNTHICRHWNQFKVISKSRKEIFYLPLHSI